MREQKAAWHFAGCFLELMAKKHYIIEKYQKDFENALVAEGQNNKKLAGTKHEDKRGLHSFSGGSAQGDWN